MHSKVINNKKKNSHVPIRRPPFLDRVAAVRAWNIFSELLLLRICQYIMNWKVLHTFIHYNLNFFELPLHHWYFLYSASLGKFVSLTTFHFKWCRMYYLGRRLIYRMFEMFFLLFLAPQHSMESKSAQSLLLLLLLLLV